MLTVSGGGTLRLVKTGSGMAGGLLGMRKVNKQLGLLSDALASWLAHQGPQIGVRSNRSGELRLLLVSLAACETVSSGLVHLRGL